MRVTFKDVGQGDSILLEWVFADTKKLAIIDCKKKGKSNPVLEFLKESEYERIEFIILSHPHTDHYSGFKELLSHCEKKNIQIGNFYQTVDRIGNKYWNFFEVDSEHSGDLRDLLLKVDELHQKKLLELRSIEAGYIIPLFDGAYIQCMAPSHEEIKSCQKIMKYDPVTFTKEQSQAANYLSTILKLRIGNDYVLLTSDAEKEAFQTVLNRRKETLANKRLLLCQMPHHGSFKNHDESFWLEIENKPKNPAVASAGKHDTYQHPHLKTLMAFHENDYSIKSTTSLYGMQEFLKERRRIGLQLEGVSSIAEEYHSAGDQVFDWDELLED